MYWTQYASHAAERMNERGITETMINEIVANGKVLSQNNGDKYAYITREGVVVLTKAGKLITAWGKANFDENMIEIVERLWGN